MTRQPMMAELDLIARGRLQAERMAGSLIAGQVIYVNPSILDAMNRWPHDTRGVGFTGTDAGWMYEGHPIKAIL